jgi:hypothetical protein
MKIVLTGDNHQQMVAAVRKAQAGLSEFLALAPNQPAPPHSFLRGRQRPSTPFQTKLR